MKIFAVTTITVLKFILNEWNIDDYTLKLISYNFDQINSLHDLPLLGQKRPLYSTVRIYWPIEKPIEIDFTRIQNDIIKNDPTIDCLFNLRIVRIKSGNPIDAFLFPWDLVKNTRSNWLNTIRLQEYTCEVPSEIKSVHILSGD